MCLGGLRPVMQPDANLTKMISFARIILVFNLVVALLRFFTSNPGDMLYDLICSLFLMLAVFSFYFIYTALYVICALLNSIYLLISIAIFIQVMLFNNKIGTGDIVVISVTIFILVFYIFAIMFTFPMYKEMKAQMLGVIGAPVDQSAAQDEERPESGSRFAAFSGRGVAVGGN
jgi:hypothetical protein